MTPELKRARQAVFDGLPWQRYQFHLQQKIQTNVTRQSLKAAVAAGIRAVFNAPGRLTAEALLALTAAKYVSTVPKLTN